MNSLRDKLDQFNAVDSNLAKLEKMWESMKARLSSALSRFFLGEDRDAYEELLVSFRTATQEMPRIDGFELSFVARGYGEVFCNWVDAGEIGDVHAYISATDWAYQQEDVLREYRVRFARARRDFVRKHALGRLREAEAALDGVWERSQGQTAPLDADEPAWRRFKRAIEETDSLLGEAVKRPPAWNALRRHMHFEQAVDLVDIRERDFPAVKADLPYVLCTEHDMVPVEAADIAELSSESSEVGEVSDELRWDRVDYEQFERLISELIANTPGWQNVKWLQKPKAPDRGRDIEAQCIIDDRLTGQVQQRVIFQCKHRPGGTVGKDDISGIAEQLELHGRVDVFVLVTSGTFSEQVVAYAEQRNKGEKLPRWELWNHWDIERRLVGKRQIAVRFGLY